ncbi:hypothetical protein C1H46_024492 [Malus baccata]|uniref:K Homology domain-containing protein n=1 Tax=Malus baccata TaxID=106549 RepID=A0A540LTZ7_MALBA|nr:hypothetical protein C1H46_024492 [Malus baccata]
MKQKKVIVVEMDRCVLGRGGKIVEKIRQESEAHFRFYPIDQIPPCASPTNELIQIKNASSFFGGSSHGIGIPAQVDPIAHWGFGPGFNASNYHSRNYSSNPEPENIGSGNMMAMLCHVDKVGSLIEKGGSSKYNTSEYMHVNLDALLDMSTNEIVKLFPAKAHIRIKIIIVD